MKSTTKAPITDRKILPKLSPVIDPIPRRLPINPPTKAPTIPRIVVAKSPAVYTSGIISLANAPDKSPKIIHENNPIEKPPINMFSLSIFVKTQKFLLKNMN